MSGNIDKVGNIIINFMIFVVVLFVGVSTRSMLRDFGLKPAEATIAYVAFIMAIFLVYFLLKKTFSSAAVSSFLHSKSFRLWGATCISWLLILQCYIYFVEPFGRMISTREMVVIIKFALIPSVLGLIIVLIYRYALKAKI